MGHDTTIVLISDPRILAVPVQECGEGSIDLLELASELVIDGSCSRIASRSPAFATARQTVGEKLIAAQRSLPGGLRLYIKEAFRPLSVQVAAFDKYSASLQKAHPTWTTEQIYREASKYVAPPAVAPHSTGGAVDLTLIRPDGTEVDMGTGFNASPAETHNAKYTNSPDISNEARKYRKLLRRALETVGFVNYPTEWWHWSYGDRYWAWATGHPYALYGSLDETNVMEKI